MIDTIFALSSGPPPAAIGVVRVSGPRARAALVALAGSVPAPRGAGLRTLRDGDGEVIDQALVLWFPGPRTATGEDCAEFHCHGGRAVVAAVRAALGGIAGLREANAGEFTRRAFENGRIDLAQAESLGDLLAAETELQRRVAQLGVGGALSREVEGWREETLALAAMIEAVLDFAEDDDILDIPPAFFARREALRQTIVHKLAMPRGERLREGIRVVVAGPPNAGKSSLFNALVGEGAAIVSSAPGTTRDVIERPVAFAGMPFLLVDTAGLRDDYSSDIEATGIERAQRELAKADLVLWLGPEGHGPEGAIEIQSRCDDPAAPVKADPAHVVSSITGAGLEGMIDHLVEQARLLLPRAGTAAISQRQALLLAEVADALEDSFCDPLLAAESLRRARQGFDRLLGRTGVEDMLDVLFARFCIGK